MQKTGVRFIRIHGRIIPLRDRLAHGAAVGAVPGFLAAGAAWSASSKVAGQGFNLLGSTFWGLKGAILGAGVGAAATLAMKNKSIPKVSNETRAAASSAFKKSFAVATTSQALRVASPFVGRGIPGFKSKIGAAIGVLDLASIAIPTISAAKAPAGGRAAVLAAGSAGTILGANLGRLGGPILRNSRRLGLR